MGCGLPLENHCIAIPFQTSFSPLILETKLNRFQWRHVSSCTNKSRLEGQQRETNHSPFQTLPHRQLLGVFTVHSINVSCLKWEPISLLAEETTKFQFPNFLKQKRKVNTPTEKVKSTLETWLRSTSVWIQCCV